MTEPLWLEPYPDVLLEGIADRAPGPDARYETKEAVALAFVAGAAAPRRRASGRCWCCATCSASGPAEVAEMLETSEASVNSALQRGAGDARVAARAPAPASARRCRAPPSSASCSRSSREAFEDGDVDRIVALLTDDALLTMPPEPAEYQGRQAIGAFLRDRFATIAGRPARLMPTRANGQPAFGYYIADAHSPITQFTNVIVLTLDGDKISGLTRFRDTGILPAFGLPRILR